MALTYAAWLKCGEKENVFRRKKWETDAGNISNYEVFDRFVYRNGVVNSFLDDNGKFFIIAAKGMGKTLLLSYKRYLLERKYLSGSDAPNVLFIPKAQPYLSFVESIKTTLSNQHISKLENWEYCKKLWVTVIELSILSHVEIDIDDFLDNLPSRALRHTKLLKNVLKNPRLVEYVFNELINLSESTLTQLVQDISNSVSSEFGRINRGIVMFFDRLDNALETAHDSIWQPIQVGLLEAAWDVMRSNHHVKIYLSIRQEAYAAHRSRNTSAISAAVVKIEYSRTEIRELLDHLVIYYENKKSLEEFIGFNTFPNTVTHKEENVYDFMFRYSIGRPRDFVQFCDELSKIKDSEGEDLNEKRMLLKERVRKISSNAIVYSLFEELRMLLKCLDTQKRFDEFLSLLKYNIFTYSEMQTICSEFNGNTCMKNCKTCSYVHHPFCDLYNMGLLGTVFKTQDRRIQHFKTPYENLIHGLRSDVDYFLIHPALREYINQIHMSTSVECHYNLFVGILVGEGVLWENRFDTLAIVNRWIFQLRTKDVRDFFEKALIGYVKKKRTGFSAKHFEEVTSRSLPIWEQRICKALVDFFKTKKLREPAPISIFVSYAYDNAAHHKKVVSFVNMLRKQMGFDAQMDSSLKEKYPDIDQMMTVGLQMDKIVIILSEEYKRKADDQQGGVWKEFKMIAEDLEKHPQKYIFVSFTKVDETVRDRISPQRIGNRWIVDLERDHLNNYSELISFIKEEKEYPFGEINAITASVRSPEIDPF